MIQDEQVIQLIWTFIFSAIFVTFMCLAFRCIFLYLIEHNCCNLQTIFSNTRILQTSKEKKVCSALDASLQKTFKEANIRRILPIIPQFVTESQGKNSCHFPLFQVAVDGRILNPELLIATRVPDYASVVGNQNTASSNENMLTDYYRNNMQQSNSSLNHHAVSSFSRSYGSYSSETHVPTDRPLYINTSMSAQQRVDIYRQLSDPPKDSEPALTFHFRNL